MKILYGIQATGNGHITRATEIIPLLQKKAQVDVLMSGMQNSVSFPYPVKYRHYGLSFVSGKSGGIDYLMTYHKTKTLRFLNDLLKLPLEDYDIIIQDFEPIIAWAGKLRGKAVIALSHQSAVINDSAPQPELFDPLGKQILKNYAPSKIEYGFHFQPYNESIFTPVIRKSVRNIKPVNKGHYTVYLPSYQDSALISYLSDYKKIRWHVFSRNAKNKYQHENVSIFPTQQETFLQSMSTSEGVLCGAGFETPAEALFLKKKLMVIPMKMQYEQQCNATALYQMGVDVIKSLTKENQNDLNNWLEKDEKTEVRFPDQTEHILLQIIEKHS
ncbi:MAG: glycosyl transferase [Bacteroidales bacterium]|nr:glycosyl transferase [Bacteroidales bacterium]